METPEQDIEDDLPWGEQPRHALSHGDNKKNDATLHHKIASALEGIKLSVQRLLGWIKECTLEECERRLKGKGPSPSSTRPARYEVK